ncbi:DUF3137 domain-containing protein [Iodidimonas sp. SYSU 1G8]|uniref:DUF3137 domain-containing protein n=1 Tax=Iodidimonas sp. SYSU 1G8 TaxID=3133967 RepID=UPI0031FF2BBA
MTSDAPWLEGFDAFRAREIDPMIGDLEAARLQAREMAMKRAIWAIPLATGVVGAVFLFLPSDFGFFAGFLAFGAAWAYVQHPIVKHQKKVKERLVTRLCGFFGLEFSVTPTRNPIPSLSQVKLLPSHNRTGLEDQISGRYKEVRVEMTELHLRQVSGSGKNRRDVTVFRGPVFNFSFPKNFSGTTIIKTDGSAFGNWLGGFGMGDNERVRLEDPEFEKHFEVYGTDQVEARYLLTPGFMEQLLSLRALLGHKVQAAFHGDSFYLAANNNENRFEVKGYSSLQVNQELERFVAEIGIVFRIVDALNLASRTRL